MSVQLAPQVVRPTPQLGASVWPPSQPGPWQLAGAQVVPLAQRSSSVRPQPVAKPAAKTTAKTAGTNAPILSAAIPSLCGRQNIPTCVLGL